MADLDQWLHNTHFLLPEKCAEGTGFLIVDSMFRLPLQARHCNDPPLYQGKSAMALWVETDGVLDASDGRSLARRTVGPNKLFCQVP